MAQVKCLARPGCSLKDRKAVSSPAQFLGKILMPFPASAAVVEAERFRAEDRIGRQGNCLAPDVVSILRDQIEDPARRSGGLWE